MSEKFSKYKKEIYKHKILNCGDTRIRDSVFRASDVSHLLGVGASGASEILAEMVEDGTIAKAPPGVSGVLRYTIAPTVRPLRQSWRKISNKKLFGELIPELNRIGVNYGN